MFKVNEIEMEMDMEKKIVMEKEKGKIGLMKYRTCFSSICNSGYSIGLVKSGLQKYLRRREVEKMKWCGRELYMFKFGWEDENEKKIGGGIYSNLKNRLIVMLDEELCFDDVNRNLLVREKLEELDNIEVYEDGLKIVYDICEILCCGRLIRVNSDINGYFGRRFMSEEGGNIEKYRLVDKSEGDDEYSDCISNFIGWFEKKDCRCYYWMFKLYEMGDGKVKRYRRSEVIYGVWKYLEGLIGGNKKLGKLFSYRLNSFYDKNKKERRMFLVGVVNMFMYRDEIDWDEEVKWEVSGVLCDVKIVIDNYCIDMHCKEGKLLGKNKKDFVEEGSYIVDEYLKYKVDEWRDYYNREGKNIGKVIEEKKVVKEKKEKVVKEKKEKVVKEKKEKVVKEKKEKVVKEKVVKEKKEKVVKEKKEKVVKEKKEKVVKEKVVKKRVVKKVEENKNESLEFISMDKLEFVRLCSNSVCGGKVMCFMVRYDGKMYIMKEGRKSMNYNVDYEMVDSCKEIFGLEKIGMRRILSDSVIEKVDKKKKEWENNWRFVKKEDVVYCMMDVIDGRKLIDEWKKNGKKECDVKEFMKIGLWRGIFGVSDFSSINIMKSGDRLISIDEHGLLGSRKKMIGDRNMKIYKEYGRLVDGVFEDLYSDKEKKIEWIKLKMMEFGFKNEIEGVLSNYENLRNKFNSEC